MIDSFNHSVSYNISDEELPSDSDQINDATLFFQSTESRLKGEIAYADAINHI